MKVEIEAKFLDTNHTQIREQLKKLGAKLITPERLMRRRNLDYPDLRLAKQRHGWVRVRSEGDVTTMSYKQTNDHGLHGTQEINLTVDNFDDATEFLNVLGLTEKAYQETRRESWRLGTTDVELDTWPWIPPFVELEGESEAEVRRVAALLELTWSEALHGDVTAAYQHYFDIEPNEIIRWPSTTFTTIPSWLERKRRKGNK